MKAVYTVICPTCRSSIGIGCRTRHGTRRQPHTSRLTLATISTGSQQVAGLAVARIERERYPFDPDDLRGIRGGQRQV